ncbi:MAG TPA: hypothetical protein PLU17_06960 [Chitinophagaceae bacterium]|nr:hypothetical protein [Chitinophagaceae bacterium]
MAVKEKILILSYCFPPSNLTPSERSLSWAKYLKDGNYYPIIITRNWDIEIKNASSDMFKSSGTDIRIEKHDDYEVHYLPYKASIKDKIFTKTIGTKFYFFYLISAFFFSILNLLYLKTTSYFNFFSYSVQLLKQTPEIKKMVVTVSPFELLGIAHLINRSTGIQWIADYRDDWSTSELYKKNIGKKFLNIFNSFYEKKWTRSATYFISVSNYYVEKIEKHIHKKGFLLTNGYMPENYSIQYPLYEEFTITYVGSIYESQPIELFLEGAKRFINMHNDELKIKLLFIGVLNEHKVVDRILKASTGIEKYISFTDRVPKKQAIEMQSKSHLLLVCSHRYLKGIPGSKLYEYIALKKNIIVYPSDGDIIEETLSQTKQGLFCSNQDDLLKHLNYQYNKYLKINNSDESEFDESEILKYSRMSQTKVLIDVLNKI